MHTGEPYSNESCIGAKQLKLIPILKGSKEIKLKKFIYRIGIYRIGLFYFLKKAAENFLPSLRKGCLIFEGLYNFEQKHKPP